MSQVVDGSSRARTRHGAIREEEVRDVDLVALERELRGAMRGEVLFDAGERAMHATDASNFRQIPYGVVRPVDRVDVLAALEVCRRHDVPVVARGGGTSLAGQTCNVAVVFDFSKHMNRILWIDPERRLARVQPGVICDHLRAAAKEHGLWWGPDPSTHDHCTFGGMIANNACGVHALMAGRTTENVHALEVVTYEGDVMELGATSPDELARILAEGGPRARVHQQLLELRDRYTAMIRERFPDIPRRVSGYNLDELLEERGFHVARALVGSEGTCALTLEATVQLVTYPAHVQLVVVGYPDVYEAADDVTAVLDTHPIGLEAIDQQLVDDMDARQVHVDAIPLLPEGKGWLLCQYAGRTPEEARQNAQALVRMLERQGRAPSTWRSYDQARGEAVWKAREAGLGATARHPVRGDAWPGWEDSAVHPSRLPAYLRELRALFDEFSYTAALYGHFGQGCVHCRINFDLVTDPGIAKYRRFLQRAAELCARHGGSFSGEHGDGQQRGELLSVMFGPELVEAMGAFKRVWDPRGRMNPGKGAADPAPLDADLRLGAGYEAQLWEPETVFSYPDDDFKFSRATLRCVGVGACRREEGGVMCPSYQALREEKHSTRGRAHLLWEMLQSDSPIRDGWQSEAVRESLDLCLSCKGCKAECPMQVDVATYKAEFLHHHHKGRLRPRVHYAFGMIFRWARVLSRAPRLANFVAGAPGIGWLARKAAGLEPRRELPSFAPDVFRRWYARHGRPNQGRGPKVLLWADTWTNHLWPEVGMAAVEVMEAAGWDVLVLERALCCGRPLYEFGMLDEARRQIRRVLTSIEPIRRTGMPVVVLEPSCATVFVDEAVNLLPHDPRARWLKDHAMLFDQFMQEWASHIRPRLDGVRIAHHLHCHHRAEFSTTTERRVLERLGARVDTLDAGCCGGAGSFGFEPDKYDVSVAVSQTRFLPELQRQPEEAVLVSDGYSCRSQAEHLTERHAFHLAQVLALALRGEAVTTDALRADAARRRRELGRMRTARRARWLPLLVALVGVAAALLGRSRR